MNGEVFKETIISLSREKADAYVTLYLEQGYRPVIIGEGIPAGGWDMHDGLSPLFPEGYSVQKGFEIITILFQDGS